MLDPQKRQKGSTGEDEDANYAAKDIEQTLEPSHLIYSRIDTSVQAEYHSEMSSKRLLWRCANYSFEDFKGELSTQNRSDL